MKFSLLKKFHTKDCVALTIADCQVELMYECGCNDKNCCNVAMETLSRPKYCPKSHLLFEDHTTKLKK